MSSVPIYSESQLNQPGQSPFSAAVQNITAPLTGEPIIFPISSTSIGNAISQGANILPSVAALSPINLNNLPFDLSSAFGSSNIQQSNSNFKVRLVSILDLVQGAPGDIKQVVFEVTPTLNEVRNVEYSSVQPVHMPGGIQVYKFTGSRTFDVSAHLISRNVADALTNIQYLQTLRSWTMPFFGNVAEFSGMPTAATMLTPDQQFASGAQQIQNGGLDAGNISLLGAPPEVLYLYGYSTSSNDTRGQINNTNGININRIPVVLTNLNISYSEEVDYIPVQITPTANTEPFPIKMDISLTLVETHSPIEYEQFSLAAFKSGTLKNF